MTKAAAKAVSDDIMVNEAGTTRPGHSESQKARGSSKLQAAKSEAMRQKLLETAVTCFSTMPYSDVSVVLIAEKAGVSRGGTQYHFRTKFDILKATVEYVHARQLESFRKDLLAVPVNEDPTDHIINAHWRHLNEPEFRAYQELVLAGRSEPALRDLLEASYQAFLIEWHETARSIIGWDFDNPQVAKLGRISHYLLVGMSFGKLGGQLGDPEIQEMLEYTKQMLSPKK